MNPKPSTKTPKRQDGEQTRQRLLQAAGQVFAERGHADATSKEICARAGANVAAVNYYFGGKDKLYEEVLVEGHRQIISTDALRAILDGAGSDVDRLRALLAHFARAATAPEPLWGARVLMRELAMPSPFASALIRQAVLPKAALARRLMGRLLKLPEEHPTVQRALMLCLLPCFSLVLFPEVLRGQVLPATASDAPGMLDDMLRYVLAGLGALAEKHKP